MISMALQITLLLMIFNQWLMAQSILSYLHFENISALLVNFVMMNKCREVINVYRPKWAAGDEAIIMKLLGHLMVSWKLSAAYAMMLITAQYAMASPASAEMKVAVFSANADSHA